MYHLTNTNNPIDFPKMQKNLYLIEYENAQWCGGSLNVVVWAQNAEEAEWLASDHMQEEQYCLFSDEYEDEYDELRDECSYTVNSVELFDENHESWKFFQDESQSEFFYPVIGEP